VAAFSEAQNAGIGWHSRYRDITLEYRDTILLGFHCRKPSFQDVSARVGLSACVRGCMEKEEEVSEGE